jgi:hypothetical protein
MTPRQAPGNRGISAKPVTLAPVMGEHLSSWWQDGA